MFNTGSADDTIILQITSAIFLNKNLKFLNLFCSLYPHSSLPTVPSCIILLMLSNLPCLPWCQILHGFLQIDKSILSDLFSTLLLHNISMHILHTTL